MAAYKDSRRAAVAVYKGSGLVVGARQWLVIRVFPVGVLFFQAFVFRLRLKFVGRFLRGFTVSLNVL